MLSEDINEKFDSDFKTPEYKLYIPLELYQRFRGYIDGCKNEISGLADVEFDPDKGGFYMTELYLVKQEVSPASTVMDDEALADLYHELIKSGKTQMPRLWWHSHADMDTFWSSIDEATMTKLQNDSYTIALESNHAQSLLCRIIQWKPFPMVIDQVKILIDYGAVEANKDVADEIKAKVSERYTQSYHYGDRSKATLFNSKVERIDLPKKRSKAIAKVLGLGLIETWDSGIQKWVYEDPHSNRVYVDKHEVLTDWTNPIEIRNYSLMD